MYGFSNARSYKYNCGGFASYAGPCGASDCGDCRNGPPPWEECPEPEFDEFDDSDVASDRVDEFLASGQALDSFLEGEGVPSELQGLFLEFLANAWTPSRAWWAVAGHSSEEEAMGAIPF